ncbi:DUF262 domain-containing protein [Psychrobacter submarinus]|uniref:DUF262 domain-containing protein n=1 Tax=Psychrobacter submarinus TaxID=154108 RepID=UPI001918BAD6|nr:DUF262 domain-containing protein [Psychrobacter submarinus]
MQNNKLEIKPIVDLLDESFYIPAYQRGYRWKEKQVQDLLEDIREFYLTSLNSEKDTFYCLQPVVVKQREDGSWEIVDGQQRLTTIYIILTCLKDIPSLLCKAPYEISYETRAKSSDFLANINEDQARDNIDFFHIYKAKEAIKSWFDEQEDSDKHNSIKTPLINLDNKSVKVIWYELSDYEVPTQVFSRLNVGKIPLVSAELIKALFLKSSNFTSESKSKDAQSLLQLTLSQEWDTIEKSLQNDAFWYFLSNKNLESNRIDLLLSLRASDHSEIENSKDELNTFLQFNELLNEDNFDMVREWKSIKRLMMTLEEWFNDRELFHLIGYLITEGKTISEIMRLSKDSRDKQHLRHKLIGQVFNLTFDAKFNALSSSDEIELKVRNHLSELDYESKNLSKIRRIFLLFNIVSLLSNPKSNSRFQFDRYKSENWDVEHIRSVASDMPEGISNQMKWLTDVKDYLDKSPVDKSAFKLDEADQDKKQRINNEINQILQAQTFQQNKFENVYKSIIEIYDPSNAEAVDNSIGNLTLLDRYSNRSYKNAIFPIKRKHIIELDKKAIYVPLCTKNVFLKYYSQNLDNMLYWSSNDRDDHHDAIVETITEYFFKNGAQ